METKQYPVSQIFGPTIQGEGPLIGTQTMFLRFAGCDFDACSWCDTKYAVNPKYPGWTKTMMTAAEICDKLSEGACSQVTISGGNPALFLDFDLLEQLAVRGMYATVETQGSRPFAPLALTFGPLKFLVISPKPPSSGMSDRMSPSIVREMIIRRNKYMQTTYLKYVVFDEKDLEWVKEFDKLMPMRAERSLSAGTDLGAVDKVADILNRTRWLIDQVQSKMYFNEFRILPQLHALLWPTRKDM